MSRFDRKALRRPDAFQREAAHLAAELRTRWPIVVGLVVVLAALLAGGLWWQARSDRREAVAAADLAAALAIFHRYEEATGAAADPVDAARAALPALREAAVAHQGTEAGATAQLYVGHALLRTGDARAAQGAYEATLAVAPNDLARDAARMGLGHARLAQGDAAGAVDTWLPLTEPGRPYRALAWLDLARAYEALGRLEEAKKAYAEGSGLLRGAQPSGGGQLAGLAEQRLAALAEAPAEAAGGPATGGSPPAR